MSGALLALVLALRPLTGAVHERAAEPGESLVSIGARLGVDVRTLALERE